MKLGSTIVKLRKERRLSQGELAKIIKISQTSLSHIELNKRTPHPRTMKKLSVALELPEPIICLLSMTEEDVPRERKLLYGHLFPIIEKMIYQIFNEPVKNDI